MHNNGDITLLLQRQSDIIAFPGDVIGARWCGRPPPSSFSHHVPRCVLRPLPPSPTAVGADLDSTDQGWGAGGRFAEGFLLD